jgi:very-short-patch-repair endonuclease
MHKKLTTKEFVDKAKAIHSTYDWANVIYINTNTKIKVGCPIHGEFEITPNQLLRETNGVYRGCQKCGRVRTSKKLLLTNDEFISKAKLIHPYYDYSLVIYRGIDTKIKIKCSIHGIFEVTPYHLLKGSKCPLCSQKHVGYCNRTDKEYFIKKLKTIFPQYNLDLVEYTTSKNKIKIMCPIHGLFEATPTHLLEGSGCPKCRRSKGEEFVAKWLSDNGYEYTPQKKFDTCKNKKQLPFDFHINNTNILIEYDGEQHFKSIRNWGGKEHLYKVINHDYIKNTWVIANGYIIIRLDYRMKYQEKIDALNVIKSYKKYN